jgi:deoxyribonuclease V
MKERVFHSWQNDFTQAKIIQEKLAQQIIISKLPSPLKKIAGFDVSYLPEKNTLIGGMVILSYPALEVMSLKVRTRPITFPYVPGFLSFREAPVILDLFGAETGDVDVFLFDGQGVAHPRGLGIAAHVGVLVDKPSVGCAKKKLVGEYDPPSNWRGASSDLVYKGNVVGKVLRTRTGIKPVFVSIGHRTNLRQSVELIISCCRKYRIPEPLRLAHQLVTTSRTATDLSEITTANF